MSDMPPVGRLCYGAAMTKLFERALDVARGLLELAGEDQRVVDMAPEEEASFQESFAQADRHEFATDEEVRAVWAKYGL